MSIKDKDGDCRKVPLDNIGILLLTSPQATLSTALMNTLAERGIVAILCNARHQPMSTIYPYRPHEEVTGRLLDQIEATKPLKKRLWQLVVYGKISHQAMVLEILGRKDAPRLRTLANQVTSGDKENREAQAARVYWSALFGSSFHREPRGQGRNNFLDFGYGILRAAMLRAIAGSGLNPSLGLAHISRRNPFCLADDLMEPFRPVVDLITFKITESEEVSAVDPDSKRILSGVLALPMLIDRGQTALARAMTVLCQGLVRSYQTKDRQMYIPGLPNDLDEQVDGLWNAMDFS